MARLLGAAATALAVFAGGPSAAQAPPDVGAAKAAAIAEAAASAGLPPAWIEAVIGAESGGDPHAVSRAGAMGLMQLMPQTWRELRGRLALGANPFDIRDNVLAGAHYLREMLDRFGPDGFLAAYNAGPQRYAQHLGGRPLPAETRAYVARLAPRLSGVAGPAPRPPPLAPSWSHSPLFPKSEPDPSHDPPMAR